MKARVTFRHLLKERWSLKLAFVLSWKKLLLAFSVDLLFRCRRFPLSAGSTAPTAMISVLCLSPSYVCFGLAPVSAPVPSLFRSCLYSPALTFTPFFTRLFPSLCMCFIISECVVLPAGNISHLCSGFDYGHTVWPYVMTWELCFIFGFP